MCEILSRIFISFVVMSLRTEGKTKVAEIVFFPLKVKRLLYEGSCFSCLKPLLQKSRGKLIQIPLSYNIFQYFFVSAILNVKPYINF